MVSVSTWIGLLWGLLQGVRHAAEPDHLAAVSTLVAERRSARAAAGYAVVWGLGHAAVLLAVELLLFEWKPRSAIPVALASATAGAARRYILGLGPLFPVPQHSIFLGPGGLMG